MKILQLCFVNNLWPSHFEVESIDIQTGTDVLLLPRHYGKNYDFIVAAPPCDQFTKANQLNWQVYPDYFIKVAEKCLQICEQSGKHWLFENPPGRIEKLIPGLTKYRICTWHGITSKKEYVVYSNRLFLFQKPLRYSGGKSISNGNKLQREAWLPEFHKEILHNVYQV
jgi:hypothetical protein